MNRFFEKGIEISEDVYLRTGNIEEALAVLDRTCSMCKSQMPCNICPIEGKRDEYLNPRKVVIHYEAATKDMAFQPREIKVIKRHKVSKPIVIERHPIMKNFIKFKKDE